MIKKWQFWDHNQYIVSLLYMPHIVKIVPRQILTRSSFDTIVQKVLEKGNTCTLDLLERNKQ